MTKPLIMFGRSPFINSIDVEALIARFDSCGFNDFGTHFAVKYNWCFDDLIVASRAANTFYDGVKNASKLELKFIPICPVPGIEPLTEPTFDEHGYLKLSRTNFTPCLALNWAILERYTDVYFVGIDHVPHDTRFVHHDGIDSEHGLNINPVMHVWFRQYVANCSKHIRIWQTNTAVREFWDLPFIDVAELLTRKETGDG